MGTQPNPPGPTTPPRGANPQPLEVSSEQIVVDQESIESEVGFEVRGILGGLPVAEQLQEYFVVFDEAGDTGPELIDKTQYRVSYLVDSNLNTSKPAGVTTDAARNVTQNFEEGTIAVVRADNATALNRNLTGELTVYDTGTIRLISTTETGSSVGAFIQTMSFFDTQGQDIVQDAEDVSIEYRADNTQETTSGIQEFIIKYEGTPVKPISSSADPFLSINANQDTITFDRDTTDAGTRVYVSFNAFLQVVWDDNANPTPVQGYLQLEQQDGGAGDFIVVKTTNFSIPHNNSSYFYPFVSTSNFKHFIENTKFRCRLVRTDGVGVNVLKIQDGRLIVRQEYLPGDVAIPGLNACTASYFEPGFTSFEPVSSSNNPQGYSIITSSVQMGYFINNGFQAKLDDQCKVFDPKGDLVTYETIQVDFNWQVGDEIRFEYNKNQVHKIVNTTELSSGAWQFTVTPAIAFGTELNHFTHYRIDPDGGYVIMNTVKDNQVAGTQPFSGIILPKFPSENLKKREDALIFDLKQAGIIEK